MAAVASIMMKVPAGLNYGVVQRNRVGHINRLPHSNLQVKCIAQDPKQPFPAEGVSPSSSIQPRTNVESVMEIACARAAMLGFVSAIAVEATTGKLVLSQLTDGGLFWLITTVVFTLVGTVTPLLQGISLSGTVFSYDAEIVNGRTAMLGLVSLAINEYVSGGPIL